MYNWTCKSYIVKKVHLNTGDNWRKQNALCLFGICIWKLFFFLFCDFDSILHLLCVEILIVNLKFFFEKILFQY